MPSHPGRASAGHRERRQLRPRLQERLPVRPAQVRQRLERPAVADGGQDVGQFAVLGSGVMDVVGHHDRQAQLPGQHGGLGDEPVVVGRRWCDSSMKKPLLAGPSPRPKTAAYRSATARAPARSPTRRRRISSPSRHPDRATSPSVSCARRAWLKRGTPFVPAMFAFETSRHRLRHPTGERASRTRWGPRLRSPIPRRSSLTGSRWPGRRARSGRGRTGRPSITSAGGAAPGAARVVRLARRGRSPLDPDPPRPDPAVRSPGR